MSQALDDQERLALVELDVDDLPYYKDMVEGPTAAGGEELCPGDHVYIWMTGYQHHGIVLDVTPTTMKVAEFTNAALEQTMFQSGSVPVASRTLSTGVQNNWQTILVEDPSTWHKAKYQANGLECWSWRPGTCYDATPDPPPVILCRIEFLMGNRHVLPDYHLLQCNCETVAYWCSTGRWMTRQGDAALKSATGVLPVVATVLAPEFALLSLATAGVAAWHSNSVNSEWEQIANRLNSNFAWFAMGKNPKLLLSPHRKDTDENTPCTDEKENREEEVEATK